METMDLLQYIKNTYGLAFNYEEQFSGFEPRKKLQTGLKALADTIEQNLYNIYVEVEELVNIH